MNRRGFLFGLGATIAIVPAASLMRIAPPPKLIVPPFKRWMSAHEYGMAVDLATSPDMTVVHVTRLAGVIRHFDYASNGDLVEVINRAVREATQLPPEMLGSHQLARRG